MAKGFGTIVRVVPAIDVQDISAPRSVSTGFEQRLVPLVRIAETAACSGGGGCLGPVARRRWGWTVVFRRASGRERASERV